MANRVYTMTISRTTVDKLGIKLYDKAAAVVGEMIANSYDADAENVEVRIPLNKWLAKKSGKNATDVGLEISVKDDGHGMTPDVIDSFYLKVGTNPRIDENRGPLSLEKKRPIMGRKGIGKLAPFGICRIIEVESAGGPKTATQFQKAHLILDYDGINEETDADYYPKIGERDGTYSGKRGTTVTLRKFLLRRTPDKETFHRQLSRIFGLQLPDFKITVHDTTTGDKFVVGELPVEIDEETKTSVKGKPVKVDDGTRLPVKGWIAYAKEPYPNPEVAGVRIYARGKYVGSTRDFNLAAGFTGEYTIRSYLVGRIDADWLDTDKGEDLIRSDRQDILWDSELGSALQKWGQSLVKKLGATSWSPRKERTWKLFLEKSNLEAEARKVYKDEEVVRKALEVGRIIGRGLEREDLKEKDYVDGVRNVCIAFAPHFLHVDALREAERVPLDQPLKAIIKAFYRARIGERASLGQIAQERIDAIKRLESMWQGGKNTDESELLSLLEESPWLVDPEWTLLSVNVTFETMRRSFELWYQKNYKKKILTTTIGSKKRPDFVMIHSGGCIEIIEIKKPDHKLANEEFERVLNYFDAMTQFLDKNPSYKTVFPKFHVTLVCDDLNLSGVHEVAYKSKLSQKELERKTWLELLGDTKKVHEAFIAVGG